MNLRDTIESIQRDLSMALLKMKDTPGQSGYLHVVDAQCKLTELGIYLNALEVIGSAGQIDPNTTPAANRYEQPGGLAPGLVARLEKDAEPRWHCAVCSTQNIPAWLDRCDSCRSPRPALAVAVGPGPGGSAA